MWSAPEVTNGDIEMYNALVETRAGSVFQASVLGEERTVLVTNLGKTLLIPGKDFTTYLQ